MKDPLTREERSKRMSLVRSKDTKPELRVRRLVNSLGFRYRLQARDLPGRPDLVIRSRRKVIFVHGCFWHRHNCKMGNRTPKTRVGFWLEKLEGNARRDTEVMRQLRNDGWAVLVIWECETKPSRLDRLASRIIAFLGSPAKLEPKVLADQTQVRTCSGDVHRKSNHHGYQRIGGEGASI